jgi:thiamine-monophosphate kinase
LGIHLAGGDTTKSSRISISITVLGEVPCGSALLRSGAKPGDIIYVSGVLGRAALAWKWMSSNLRRKSVGKLTPRRLAATRTLRSFLQPHLYPEIKVELGVWLAKNRMATAAMDLSDGLSTDLSRLCAASGVGARIASPSIPLPSLPPKLASMKEFIKLCLDPLDLALHGGEDYELLFTVPQSRAKLLRRAPGFSSLVPIGEIMSGNDIIIFELKGRSFPLSRGGWDPFRDK